MKGKAGFILIILLCVLCHACVEPYELKSISYDNKLVVEGLITNTEKPQQIKLSRTSPLDQSISIAEKEAIVSIETSSGNKISFAEVNPGIYESLSFAGIVGEGYTLSVTTSNGNQYQSNQVVLKSVPSIGKINAEFVTDPQRGIQISVDTEDPLNATHYYRWSYIETYEIQVPFPSDYVVLPGATEASWRYDQVGQCWGTDTLKNVLIKNTRGQDQDKVVAFPLRFIPEDSYIFRIKYSVLLQQYALSEQAYRYWETTRVFNETQGSLTDAQPGAINSNVAGVTDPSETVLGYFDAGAVTEQRVFFDYKDFKSAGYVRPNFRSTCETITPILVKEMAVAEYMLTHGSYLSIWEVIGVSPVADFELLPKECCDCSNMGVTVKPSYWK